MKTALIDSTTGGLVIKMGLCTKLLYVFMNALLFPEDSVFDECTGPGL